MSRRPSLLDLAYAGRRTPLRPALRRAREGVDRAFVATGRPAMTVSYEGLRVGGFLRHRDFLRGLEQAYEAGSMRLFDEALAPGAVVVDGGAHVGAFSLRAAGRVGAGGRVIAIEADPYNHRALLGNVQRNRLTNTEVHHAGLSDREGTATFFASRGTVASSLVDKDYVDDARPVEVRLVTLDSLVGGEPERLVVKLDVEGVEAQVLAGAVRVLSAARSARVLAEHNPGALRSAGRPTDEVVTLLRELGFDVRVVDEQTARPKPLTAETLETKCNLVADKGFEAPA